MYWAKWWAFTDTAKCLHYNYISLVISQIERLGSRTNTSCNTKDTTIPSLQRFFFYTMSFWLAIKKIMNNKLNFKKAMIQTRHPSKHHHEWIHRRLLMYLSTAFTAPSHTLNFWFWKCMSVWWFSNSSNSSAEWSYVSNTSCVHFQTHIHSHMSMLYGMSHVNFSSTLKILSPLWSLT